jgi:Ras-related protein Rab-11A
LVVAPISSTPAALTRHPEIYRIVSSKAIEGGEGGSGSIPDRRVIDFTPQDSEQKQGCC